MTINELKELALKATPGPWKLEFQRLFGPEVYRDCGDKVQFAYSKDAQFIAAVNPTAILELIDRYEKAIEMLEILMTNKNNCGCESGNYFDPSFTCGFHKGLEKFGPDKPLGEK